MPQLRLVLLLSATLLLLFAGATSAFSPVSTSQRRPPTSKTRALSLPSALLDDNNNNNNKETTTTTNTSRRRAFCLSFLPAAAATFLPVQQANAGLLDEYGTDPKKIAEPPKKQVDAAAVAAKPTGDVQIDPTLRGSYYYPTAKKRYLPRIQKVTNEIAIIPDAIAANDWQTVGSFAKTAENAILPLQLYQSSLDGQGLSMSNSYAKIMKEDAIKYEKSYKVLERAIPRTDGDAALQAVIDMGMAIADYRQQGRLRDDDGNIPSVDDMRRMAMRKQTGKYQ